MAAIAADIVVAVDNRVVAHTETAVSPMVAVAAIVVAVVGTATEVDNRIEVAHNWVALATADSQYSVVAIADIVVVDLALLDLVVAVVAWVWSGAEGNPQRSGRRRVTP